MKAIVDAEACIGCEVCVGICPDVFDMQDGVAIVKTDPVPEHLEGEAAEAAASCPVDAIAIEEV